MGLTPASLETQDDSSDDEADDNEVDEEALHAELGSKLTFEHNGVVTSLSSAADLKAWQEERRRMWPTRARMTEKDAERIRIGKERRRLLAEAASLNEPTKRAPKLQVKGSSSCQPPIIPIDEAQVEGQQIKQNVIAKPESELQRARRELAEQTAQVEGLRRRVAQGEAILENARKAKTTQEEGTANDLIQKAVDTVQDNAELYSPSSESSIVSQDSEPEEPSDDDEPPEETTAKAPPTNAQPSQRLPCKFFIASGRCRDGDACRFEHELPERKSGANAQISSQGPGLPRSMPKSQWHDDGTSARKGIYERLMEQQQEEEDRLALQIIKHLGQAGFFATGVEESDGM